MLDPGEGASLSHPEGNPLLLVGRICLYYTGALEVTGCTWPTQVSYRTPEDKREFFQFFYLVHSV